MRFGCNPQINFVTFLQLGYLACLLPKHIDWISCERIASPLGILAGFFETLQLFCQGLKICMLCGCNPQIIFCHFFRSLKLVILIDFYQSI